MMFPDALQHCVPWHKCPACGSEWFHEVSFREFVPAQPRPYDRHLGRDLPVLVCLCGGVARQQLQALQAQLHSLEHAFGQALARQETAACLRDPRGRPWKPPKPKTALSPSRTKSRDWLESQVRQCGLTAREAHAVVAAVLDTIKEGLRRDGTVATPLGEFYTTSRTEPYQRKRPEPKKGTGPKAIFEQTLQLHPTRVRFKPEPSWANQGGFTK